MNPHLSGEQISKYLIGDRSAQETQHVLDCAACGGEIARLESSFSQFRSSVRHWSDRRSVTDGVVPWTARVEVATLQGLYSPHKTIAGIGSVLIHVAVVAAAPGRGLAPASAEGDERIRPVVRTGSDAASA